MYLSEFRVNWQQILAASLGIALGTSLSHYAMSRWCQTNGAPVAKPADNR